MIKQSLNPIGFHIPAVETCNFNEMQALSNREILELAGHADSEKLAHFIESKMGITKRYHCDSKTDALDLARQALQNLIETQPSIVKEADFLIYAGISNPLPVATHSAILGAEFGFDKPSCWDIKSGCSSAVLALIQASNWLQMGARKGVIIASETLSKFSDPSVLQMHAAVGDGAVALVVERSEQWRIKSMVHGTDPQFVKNMLVKGKFPVENSDYERNDYRFSFNDKGNSIEVLKKYWVQSLSELLDIAQVKPDAISHYIAHQVDGQKNSDIAKFCGLSDSCVAKNFRHYGNMGAPTIFINFKQWMEQDGHQFNSGDHLLFHAVGGGLSWAGICLEKKS